MFRFYFITPVTFQILQYDIGQQYVAHFDWFDPVHFGHYLENGGQRVATVLVRSIHLSRDQCFLNDVEEGGETEFPAVNLRVAPKKGAAILWYNMQSK